MTYLQPDIWVKGGDYVKDSSELKNGKQLMDQDERRAIESYGGNIVFIPVEVDVSTTKIADKLQRK
jgi:bifunctional ADP-heptose synthase (sugar kinase/adenylyltransferase)